MSIINDALKKAQENLKNKQNTEGQSINNEQKTENNNANNPAHNPESNPGDPKNESKPIPLPVKEPYNEETKKKAMRAIGSAIVVIIIIALAIYMITVKSPGLNLGGPTKNKTKVSLKNPSSSDNVTKQAIEGLKGKLSLEGTIQIGDQRAALISGEVYRVGDKIEGLKILDIQIKRVELENANGQKITLGVAR